MNDDKVKVYLMDGRTDEGELFVTMGPCARLSYENGRFRLYEISKIKNVELIKKGYRHTRQDRENASKPKSDMPVYLL